MSSESGWRIAVAIMLMGVCGWLIYGAIVGGANAGERDRPGPQRPITVAAEPTAVHGAANDAPKARPGNTGPRDDAPNAGPGHPGRRDKPPQHVPPNARRAASLVA